MPPARLVLSILAVLSFAGCDGGTVSGPSDTGPAAAEDASPESADASARADAAEVEVPDADEEAPDATGGRDAARRDASTPPRPDASEPGFDAASPGPDAALPGPDAAGPGPDAATLVVGVHTPVPVDPTVDILDGHWLLDLYRVVLGREHDAAGYTVNRKALEAGSTRSAILSAFVASAEFKATPALADRSGFVTRLYQTLLLRTPGAQETASQVAQLKEADGSGAGLTWEELIEAFYASAEFKAARCQKGAYTLGAPVAPGKLLLSDLFAGRARMQTLAESQEVHLTVPSALALWDQKLPVLRDPQANRWLGFTRAYVVANPGLFTIVLLTSSDGVSFTEVGPVLERTGGQTFYDPHLSLDSGACPERHVMAMECLGTEGAASLCVSQTTTPGWPETWSAPKVVVDGCTGNAAGNCHTAAAESASTGAALTDGHARYVAWTQVYDGVGANDPLAHTYSQAAPVASYAAYFGTVVAGSGPISTLLSATPQPWCTGSWDCNNRDKQDWKKEGAFFYALYNGANYYRCDGTWGLSVARSPTAVGAEYTDRLDLSRGIAAERDDTCGISYSVLNVVDGEPYVYFAYYPAAGGNKTMRAKLVPAP